MPVLDNPRTLSDTLRDAADRFDRGEFSECLIAGSDGQIIAIAVGKPNGTDASIGLETLTRVAHESACRRTAVYFEDLADGTPR